MPFSRISLIKGKSPEYLHAVSTSLHRALVEAFDVPPTDRFQVIHQLEANELIFDRHYMGGPRSDDFILINVTAGRPRDVATKQNFYQRLVALLADAPGVHPEDVMVVINTTNAEDWSFAAGRAWNGKVPESARAGSATTPVNA
jgi:phenylpyruvate tautomerase PptA (4-oxalocrotonate tautomerase family)